MSYVLGGQMLTFCHVELAYTLRCSVCATTVTWQTLYGPFCAVQWEQLPAGWQSVDGDLCCPAHDVDVVPSLMLSEEDSV